MGTKERLVEELRAEDTEAYMLSSTIITVFERGFRQILTDRPTLQAEYIRLILQASGRPTGICTG